MSRLVQFNLFIWFILLKIFDMVNVCPASQKSHISTQWIGAASLWHASATWDWSDEKLELFASLS